MRSVPSDLTDEARAASPTLSPPRFDAPPLGEIDSPSPNISASDARSEITTFTVDAGLIDRLGRELVAKQETAVAELIKNAYDADATRVSVEFEAVDAPGGRVTITDDGDGMTREQLFQGFLRISTTAKLGQDRSPGLGRPRAGQKGIGRFSAQRLAERLVLRTTARGSRETLELDIRWEDFAPSRDLAGVPVRLRAFPADGETHGTTLDLRGLREAWSDAQIRRVYRHILGLLRPITRGIIGPDEIARNCIAPSAVQTGLLAAPVLTDPERFEVSFLWERSNGRELRGLDEQEMLLENAVAQFEVVVGVDGRAHMKVMSSRLGMEELEQIGGASGPSGAAPWAALAGRVMLRGHYFIHGDGLVPKLFASRVKELLNDQGGFRVFRNGFRVLPYGTPGDDWAELDSSTRKRSLLPVHANSNWLAAVLINDSPHPPIFVETSSREGFIESDAFLELRRLIYAAVASIVTRVANARGRKVHAGDETREAPEERLRKTAARIRAQAEREAAKSPDPKIKASWRSLNEAAGEIESGARVVELERRQTLDELAALRILAALGLAAGEFAHEIRHLLAEMANQLALLLLREDGPPLPEPSLAALEGLRQTSKGVQAQAALFDRAIADRAQREVQPQDLRALLDRFRGLILSRAEKLHIHLSTKARGSDLVTVPMHETEWISVLLNLYTNAERAVLRGATPRRIDFEVRASADGRELVLRCSDGGSGVRPQLRGRIFEPFFTTTSSAEGLGPDGTITQGTGLGLHITREILTARNGTISLLSEPQASFATTFEVRIPRFRANGVAP